MVRLDENEVSEYLADIYAFDISAYVPSPDISALGLEHPTMKITAESRYQDSEILIGDRDPDGEFYYAKSPETDEVYIVNKALVDTLLHPVKEK